jgi:flavin reductase (DIM6/NTAB) family NADH-FMN oxidoreductase RutF
MKKEFLMIVLSVVQIAVISQSSIENMESFEKKDWRALNENIIQLIGKEWMLVAAGSPEKDFNMMTASWGGMGWLWEKPVAFIFVRPQRYTHVFTEREDYFTLTFFNESEKYILEKMGTVSGKNFDKMNYSELTPLTTPNGSIAFAEARIVIECKKLYATEIVEKDFTDPTVVQSKYPQKDFHTMYVGEIVNVWIKKE